MFSARKNAVINEIKSFKIIILKTLNLNDVFSFLLNFGGITESQPKIIKIAITNTNKTGIIHTAVTRLPSVIL